MNLTAQKDNGCKTFQRCAEDVTRTFNNGAAKTSRCRRASCNGSWIDFTSESEDSILALTSYISKSTLQVCPMIKETNIIVWSNALYSLVKPTGMERACPTCTTPDYFDQQAYLWRVANERAAVTRFGAGATLAQTPTSFLPPRLARGTIRLH